MLRVVPKGLFSWSVTVYEDGTPLLDMDVAWIREAGAFELGDSVYRVYRQSLLAIRIFLIWLVLILWRRAAQSSAAATGG